MLLLYLVAGFGFTQDTGDADFITRYFMVALCLALVYPLWVVFWVIARATSIWSQRLQGYLEKHDERSWRRAKWWSGEWASTSHEMNKNAIVELLRAYEACGVETIVQSLEPLELEDLLCALRSVAAVARIGASESHGQAFALILGHGRTVREELGKTETHAASPVAADPSREASKSLGGLISGQSTSNASPLRLDLVSAGGHEISEADEDGDSSTAISL